MTKIGKCQICEALFRWHPEINAFSCHPNYGIWCVPCQQAADRSIDEPTEGELAERAAKREKAFG